MKKNELNLLRPSLASAVRAGSIALGSALVCLAALCTAACSDEGLIYPSNVADAIPDREFRVLCMQIADTNLDGVISKEEALAVKKIDCTPGASYVGTMSNLEGLQYFANLEELHCKKQQLTSLDVSGNRHLRVIGCAFNPLGRLDVSMCTELDMLVCDDCELKELRLPRTTTLTALSCSGNRLTELDVTGYPALAGLYCDKNLLTALDLRSNPELRVLRCSDIEGLDMSGNPKLEQLSCSGGSMGRFDLSRHAALTRLSVYDSRMTSIEFAADAALTYLQLYKTECERLNLESCPHLHTLLISEAPLRELALPEGAYSHIMLMKIPVEQLEVKCSVGDNAIWTTVHIEECGQLRQLAVATGNLALDCENCPKLSDLDLSGCRILREFKCTGTALASLDLSPWTDQAMSIVCNDNRLTSLVLPPTVYSLRCDGNLLEELDVSDSYITLGDVKCLPMETLRRIRLRRDQRQLFRDVTGLELIYVD